MTNFLFIAVISCLVKNFIMAANSNLSKSGNYKCADVYCINLDTYSKLDVPTDPIRVIKKGYWSRVYIEELRKKIVKVKLLYIKPWLLVEKFNFVDSFLVYRNKLSSEKLSPACGLSCYWMPRPEANR